MSNNSLSAGQLAYIKQRDKEAAIKIACGDCDYKWPKDLSSGVMFYHGHRITIEEFNRFAEGFK